MSARLSRAPRRVRRASPERPLPPADVITVAGFRAAGRHELARLFAWYREPQRTPFFTGINGPFPSFSFDGFCTFCTQQARTWVDEEVTAFIRFDHIQTTMHVANADFGFRAPPTPGSPGIVRLNQVLDGLGAFLDISKAQLFSLASDHPRLALCDALGMRREGELTDHFYFERENHDLICSGWLRGAHG